MVTGQDSIARVHIFHRSTTTARKNTKSRSKHGKGTVMSLTQGQYRAIVWISRSSSIISLAGSSFIIGTFMFSSHFQSSINRLMFYAAWGNIITNVGSLMSRGPLLNSPDGSWCQFQAFILHWYCYPIFIPSCSLRTCLQG